MIELRETTFIEVPPATVWAWLEHLPDHYTDWHPDHISCRWVRGRTLTPGAEIEFVENLHGKPHRLRARLTAVVPERKLHYRMGPGLTGSFVIEKAAAGSDVTATIRIGVDIPVLGKWLDRVLRRILAPRIRAFARHQAEEGRTLKATLEARNRV